MDKHNALAKTKIGIQVKSTLVLVFVVFSATAAGGWLHYTVTRQTLQHNDYLQADQLATGLALAAGSDLVSCNGPNLQKHVNALVKQPNVHRVTILDRDGKSVARASRLRDELEETEVVSRLPSLSYDLRRGSEFLEMGRPVVIQAEGAGQDKLVGGVRLLLDTRPTARILAGVQREMLFTVAIILLCAILLGQVLVWRVLGVPLRRLVQATHRLAEGDWSARVERRRSDEIGELASSFDTMAEKLHASQQQLRAANESLEQNVAERTSELEQANRRLRDEMAEKEDFLRAVSHDLNAPLRNIAGMATMIARKYRNVLPAEVLARLDRIQANVNAETDLLAELLELSRIRTRPQKREVVDFAEMLEDLKGAFEYELKQRGIVMEIRGPMPSLYVERNRMRQLFQNLIDNAIKYMGQRKDGRIEIGCTGSNGMHQFYVSDNGPGIAPKDQERVFYVFRRGAAADNTAVPGKGVGLALVRGIARAYGGRAWVESEPGAGSTFYVSLRARQTRPSEKDFTSERARTEAGHVPASGHPVG